MLKSIIELEAKEARKYLLQPSSYCTINLPEYIDFTEILKFVGTIVGNKDLNTCLADHKVYPSEYENVNYKFLTNKDGKFAYRCLQLTNPYLYYILVRTITEDNNWLEIQSHFLNHKRPNIEVVSIPKVKHPNASLQAGADIITWWEYFEQESITLSLQYQYLFVTDITDCYGSIYTHTIPWSLYGKEKAKQDRQKHNLGKILDNYMGAMNYKQTNGIPQGSVLYDLIAELVLVYADSSLYNRLSVLGIKDTDYRILRYRDDYRVFSNDKSKLEILIRELQQILSNLNFRMNSSKTFMTEDVLLKSMKTDKLAFIYSAPKYFGDKTESVQKELLYILQFAKEYPNSGTVSRLLTILLKHVESEALNIANIKVLISITVEIMMTSPRVFNVGTALLSYFLDKLDDGKIDVIKSIYNKLRRLSNTGELEIWLQRITYHLDDVDISYEEPLTKLVKGDINVSLWDNTWLKQQMLEKFPIKSICNIAKRDALTPIITSKEIDMFEY